MFVKKKLPRVLHLPLRVELLSLLAKQVNWSPAEEEIVGQVSREENYVHGEEKDHDFS